MYAKTDRIYGQKFYVYNIVTTFLGNVWYDKDEHVNDVRIEDEDEDGDQHGDEYGQQRKTADSFNGSGR